jgi:hypothetical protein
MKYYGEKPASSGAGGLPGKEIRNENRGSETASSVF